MGIILPFVGYATYRLASSRAPLLSTRRAVAAGIGGYVGITVAALVVGILLGLQPILFTEGGRPLYSPYGLETAVPAMLAAHMFGASIVEALITGLGIAYLQKRHPELLVSLKSVFAADAITQGTASLRPMWQIITGTVLGGIAVLAVVGLAMGGGDPGHLFGADWSTVSGPDIGVMLAVTAVIAFVIVPLAYLVLPKRLKRVGAAFTAIAVLAPLGLIAPGLAFGEGSTGDVQAAFGYVPQGLHDLANVFSAPLSGYDIPLPFFNGATSGLWQVGIGYEIAGIIGILLCGGAVIGLTRLIRRIGGSADPAEAPTT